MRSQLQSIQAFIGAILQCLPPPTATVVEHIFHQAYGHQQNQHQQNEEVQDHQQPQCDEQPQSNDIIPIIILIIINL